MDEIDVIKPREETVAPSGQMIKKTFPVTGMSCAACASSVESMLATTEGVSSASVNFASSSVLIEYAPSLSDRPAKCRTLGGV